MVSALISNVYIMMGIIFISDFVNSAISYFTLEVIDTPTRPSLRLPSITPNLFSGSLMEVLNLCYFNYFLIFDKKIDFHLLSAL